MYTLHFCGTCGESYDDPESVRGCERKCSRKEPRPKFKPRERAVMYDPIHGGEETPVIIRRLKWLGDGVHYDIDSADPTILSTPMPEGYLKKPG
jgi:hypothetical protein